MINHIAYQPLLFDILQEEEQTHSKPEYTTRSGCFVDNMKLPVHRWFRYSAGFSADWVCSVIDKKKSQHSGCVVLDPFAGIGTTLLACNNERIKSLGFESHPFIYRMAKSKLNALNLVPSDLQEYLNKFLIMVSEYSNTLPDNIPTLLKKCYTKEALIVLYKFKDIYFEYYNNGSAESEVVWLIITAILRSCSTAGTAQWQYVLPNKTKNKVLDPYIAFGKKAVEIISDIDHAHHCHWANKAEIYLTDARQPDIETNNHCDLVITSPPYPNNYDYADATRLEMIFWGDITGWSDLQPKVRKYLVRSCSQHSAAEKLKLHDVLQDEILKPIHCDLSKACLELAKIRLTRGGKKTYHTMAAAYFKDLGYVFKSLRKICRSGSEMCFVIGDSAPYGVYLNVDKWLGELAVSVGFTSYTFEKIRDRNIKWKNRKHNVPLKEGRLWIKG